jgi:hypothetical protein
MNTIKPDDQVLDWLIYQNKISAFRKDVDKFLTGYQFWASTHKRNGG